MRRFVLATLVGALVALLSACGTGEVSSPTPAAPASAVAPSGPTTGPAGTDPGSPETPAPTRIRYEGIGATSTLLALGLNPDRTLATPDVNNPEQAAWYSGSPRPGDPGPSIVMGHINGGGRPGVFVNLASARQGDLFSVDRGDGSVATFEVYEVKVVDKASFPTAEVYSNTPGPEMRLISCGGALDSDARSYRSNVIVKAKLDSIA